jgi:hypothetical protein
VRDLADREAACCPFLTYAVTVQDGQVICRIGADGVPMADAILDEIHDLPEQIAEGFPGMLDRLRDAGMDVKTSHDGSITTATPTR